MARLPLTTADQNWIGLVGWAVQKPAYQNQTRHLEHLVDQIQRVVLKMIDRSQTVVLGMMVGRNQKAALETAGRMKAGQKLVYWTLID